MSILHQTPLEELEAQLVEPLTIVGDKLLKEKETSVEDMQKIMDANEKLVKELKHECDSSN